MWMWIIAGLFVIVIAIIIIRRMNGKEESYSGGSFIDRVKSKGRNLIECCFH